MRITEKFLFLLRCFDGLSKEIINIEISKRSEIENFSILLFDILNSFTILYDDYWVFDNLKKMESQVSIEAQIIYKNFQEWNFIKDLIISSNNVNFFSIFRLSTRESYAKIKIINENKFLTELENNNLIIKRDKNVWNIKKFN